MRVEYKLKLMWATANRKNDCIMPSLRKSPVNLKANYQKLKPKLRNKTPWVLDLY